MWHVTDIHRACTTDLELFACAHQQQKTIWMCRLVDKSGVTAAVDPCEPHKLIKAAGKEGLKISKVLTTHHHWQASIKFCRQPFSIWSTGTRQCMQA